VQLENSFTVPVPVDEAWRVLLDIERIAPCMPGAALDSVDGDDFTGRVKVKLGPINLTYQGKASFVEKDEAAHRAVLRVRSKEQGGNGYANADVTFTVNDGEGTVHTHAQISGKAASMGEGVVAGVLDALINDFTGKLATL